MGHLLDTVQSTDVIQCIDTRGQTAVEAEDLVVDEGGKGEVIKKVGKVLPHIGVAVLAQAFVVKAVNLSDLARLVIAAQNCNP